jgi:hypothetical protein
VRLIVRMVHPLIGQVINEPQMPTPSSSPDQLRVGQEMGCEHPHLEG